MAKGLDLHFQIMNQEEAEEIANNWKYDGVYSFYDFSNDIDDYMELVDKSKRFNNYFSCQYCNELIGFFAKQIQEEDLIQFGLGLKPNFTGKGYGLYYINTVMDHIVSIHGIVNFTLIVACFNQRAINVYKKAGFIEDKIFMHCTNGGEYEFLKMTKKNIQTF